MKNLITRTSDLIIKIDDLTGVVKDYSSRYPEKTKILIFVSVIEILDMSIICFTCHFYLGLV